MEDEEQQKKRELAISRRFALSPISIMKKARKNPGPLNWLPGADDLRTTTPIDSITYKQIQREKSPLNEASETEKTDVVNQPQHIIHKAVGWKKILDDGEVESLSEIAKKEGLTRARVPQIMNLLKLPTDWKNFLLGLIDPKEIRKYSERKLRNYQAGRYAPPPIKKDLRQEPMVELRKKSRGKEGKATAQDHRRGS